jgi:hypothetical protein
MDNVRTDSSAERSREREAGPETVPDTSPASDTPPPLPADDDSDVGDTDQHSDA